MHTLMSRRRALIATAVTAALVVTGVGLVAGPALADTMEYTDVSDAFAAATSTEATFTLGNDVVGDTHELQLPDDAKLVLDLDGSDLSLGQLTLGTGSSLEITDSGSGDPGTLTVGWTFTNEGGIRTTGATLTIDGQAVVVATGGGNVAGIGGGNNAAAGTLTIGGTADVTATGGDNAAGIGGGALGGGGAVTIEGDATVLATGGDNGAGIGGGKMVGNGTTTIRGNADVTANGGNSAAGIGGGNTQGGGTVLIEGASTVQAKGGPGGSGIGANGTAGVQSITIQGTAQVTATAVSGASVGIGSGFGVGGDLTFAEDAVVTATAGTSGFGIGTGVAAHPADIGILDDAHVTASGGLGSVGGTDDAFGTITVDGELTIPAGQHLTIPSYLDAIAGTGSLTGGGTVNNSGSISLPDANVTAAVTGRNYTIAVALNGGTVSPPVTSIRVLSVTMYLSGREFPAATRSGYVLTGWKNGAAAFTDQSLVSSGITITAQWSSYPATVPVPLITGSAKVGQSLTADPRSAQWAPGTTFTYSWLRNGVAIANTNSTGYTITGADLGKQLSVKVTGTNPGQPTVIKTSAVTAKVVAGTLGGSYAQISGDYVVGGTLYSNASSWEPTAKFSYQWYADGVAISKATTRNWVVTSAATGKLVSVRVTISALGYTSVPLVALANTPVALGQFLTTPTPTITGTVQAGQKLTAVPGVWPVKATFSYQWYRDGDPVPGATASTLVLPANAMGSTWNVRVTGSAAGYTSAFATSATTGPALGTLTGATPKITGTAKVGSTLTAVPGTWTGGTTLSYEWLRVSGTTTTVIAGATNATYTLEPADKGKTIKVRVTGTQAGYGALVKLSSATAKVP